MKMLITVLLILVAVRTAFGQANTITTGPCADERCINQKFSYRFCDQFGHMVEKCSSNPNNDKDFSPPLRPAKKATPLCLRGDWSGLEFQRITIDPSLPADPGLNVIVFDLIDMQGILTQAEREWTWLCPGQGPNREYNYCCLTVKFSDRWTSFQGLDKASTRAFVHDPVQDFLGDEAYCRTDCQGSELVLNGERPFTLIEKNGGVPKNFFFTRNPNGAQNLVPELKYASMHSILLHEIGHWLGLGHSGADQFGKYCGTSGSIMVPGYVGEWSWVDRGLTEEDKCAFMKLYCCASTADALEVDDDGAIAESRSFQVVPNPAHQGTVTVALSDALYGHALSLRMLNSAGDVVLERAVSREERELVIDIAELAGGAYFMQVTHDQGVAGYKVTVQR